MFTQKIALFTFFSMVVSVSFSQQETPAQQSAKTEVWQPVPKVITPAATPGDAPSDAIVLFAGDNLNQWVSTKDTTRSAGWVVSGDVFMVKKGTGNTSILCKQWSYLSVSNRF